MTIINPSMVSPGSITAHKGDEGKVYIGNRVSLTTKPLSILHGNYISASDASAEGFSVPVRAGRADYSTDTITDIMKSISSLNASNFQRQGIVELIELIVTSVQSFLAEAENVAKHAQLARTMAQNSSHDIDSQGNAILIQSCVSGVAGGVCSIGAGLANYKQAANNATGYNLKQEGLAINEADKLKLSENAAKVSAAFESAQSWAHVSPFFKTVGDVGTAAGTGATKKIELQAAADQKVQEQNAHASNSLTDASSTEKQRLKDFLSQVLSILQTMIDDQKQASDSAAMKC